MKKTILALLLTCSLSTLVNAQHKKGREKIRTYKISYITEKLNLTPDEAEKFWPLYNKYDKKMMQLHREERFNIKRKIKNKGGIDNITEKESEDFLKKIRLLSQERYKIKADFHNKISKVLPYKKILTLEITEHDFHRNLIKKFKRKKI